MEVLTYLLVFPQEVGCCYSLSLIRDYLETINLAIISH